MKVNNPNYLNGLSSSANEIDGSVNLAHPSLNSFLYQARDNTRNMGILVNSDSTGNSTNEWVQYFAEWLGETYPAYTVRIAFWNDATNSYDTLTTVSTGTGSYYMDIWNFANPGQQPFYILSPSKILNSFQKIVSTTGSSTIIDLTIINHGHNADLNSRQTSKVNKFLLFTEECIKMHPFSSYLIIWQNPTRDNYDNKNRVWAAVEAAKIKNICIANAWDKFEALNKDSSLYEDNVHPSYGLGTSENPTGTQLFLEAVTEQLLKKPNLNFVNMTSFLNQTCDSINSNPNLTSLDAVTFVPVGYAVSGGTCSKDTSIFINKKKGYSTRLTATGGTACKLSLEYDTSMTDKWNKTFTVAIRMYSTPSTDTSYARAALISTSDAAQDLGVWPLNGGWSWRFITVKVGPSDQYLRAYVYVSSSSGATAGQYVNIDKIVLVEGSIPYGNSI